MSESPSSRSYERVIEQEFLPLRAKVLETAAGLDRLDRAAGHPPNDEPRRRLAAAIRILLDDQGDRAARVQMLFSREYDAAWRTKFEV